MNRWQIKSRQAEEKDPQRLADLDFLLARYDHEVHVTIEGLEGSHSLAYWRHYFRAHPKDFTAVRRRRLDYAAGFNLIDEETT